MNWFVSDLGGSDSLLKQIIDGKLKAAYSSLV